MLDSSACTFTQTDSRSVYVTGSRFKPTEAYTVKLEGVSRAGFRSIFIAGVRDPVLTAGFTDFAAACQARTRDQARSLEIDDNGYTVAFRIYGAGAVMGDREFAAQNLAPTELCIIGEVIADDEATSRAVLAKARYALLHPDFDGRLCISGNLAFPFSPSDISVGDVFDFSVWHTLELDDPLELFPVTYQDIVS